MVYEILNENGEVINRLNADEEFISKHFSNYRLADMGFVSESTTLSSLNFMERFTEAEQLAIVSATLSSPSVKLWYDKLLAANEVRKGDNRLSAGLSTLVSEGLITEERKDEVLSW